MDKPGTAYVYTCNI